MAKPPCQVKITDRALIMQMEEHLSESQANAIRQIFKPQALGTEPMSFPDRLRQEELDHPQYE